MTTQLKEERERLPRANPQNYITIGAVLEPPFSLDSDLTHTDRGSYIPIANENYGFADTEQVANFD